MNMKRKIIRNKPCHRLYYAKYWFKWKPHPTQRKWFKNNSKVKVAACGRRWGKTEAAAVDVATYAVTTPGSVQMIVSPTYDQSKLIFNKIESLMMKNKRFRKHIIITRTPYPRLQFNGSVIMARTASEDGRNLRGNYADRVIIDEAAYVKDAVVEEVIAPMLADKNGQLIMLSTPFGKNHFYRAFIAGREGKGAGSKSRYASFRFPSWKNPHISRKYIEAQRETITPRQFSVEYEAEFLDDQASVFSWDMIQSAIALGKTAVASDEPWLVAGVDWARYSDYTTVAVMDVRSNPSKVIAMDRFNRLSWEAQVSRVAAFLEYFNVNAVLADQTSVGDPLLEQLRNRLWEHNTGISVDGLIFTNTSKRELIDHLVIKLANGELGIPDDEQLIRELQYFEYELTTAGNVRMNARVGYTDDLVIALALAAWKGKNCSTSARFLSSSRRRDSLE